MRKAMLASIIAIAWISLIPALLSTAASAANSASFVKTDSTTMGSWIGVYGANGYFVSQDGTIKNPSYAKVVFSEDANWTWAASSNHLPALQKPEKPSDRISGQWFTGNSFLIDVNTQQVALYALDWDQDMRAETIKVHDASTGAVLDTGFYEREDTSRHLSHLECARTRHIRGRQKRGCEYDSQRRVLR